MPKDDVWAALQSTNTLLTAVVRALARQEQLLTDIKTIFAPDELVEPDPVGSFGNLMKPADGGLTLAGESQFIGTDGGSGVTRFPMPDHAWVVMYTDDDGQPTGIFYEDRTGNRAPVAIDDMGNVVLAS